MTRFFAAYAAMILPDTVLALSFAVHLRLAGSEFDAGNFWILAGTTLAAAFIVVLVAWRFTALKRGFESLSGAYVAAVLLSISTTALAQIVSGIFSNFGLFTFHTHVQPVGVSSESSWIIAGLSIFLNSLSDLIIAAPCALLLALWLPPAGEARSARRGQISIARLYFALIAPVVILLAPLILETLMHFWQTAWFVNHTATSFQILALQAALLAPGFSALAFTAVLVLIATPWWLGAFIFRERLSEMSGHKWTSILGTWLGIVVTLVAIGHSIQNSQLQSKSESLSALWLIGNIVGAFAIFGSLLALSLMGACDQRRASMRTILLAQPFWLTGKRSLD